MKEGDLILVSAEATGLGEPMEAVIDKIETFMGQTLVTATYTQPDALSGFGGCFVDSYKSGGFYISPSAGISLPVTKKTSIHVGIGYTYNQAKYEFSYIPGIGSMGRNNKRFNAGGLTLSVGVSF